MEQDVIKSYAKINLGLWITEKRADGYHNIVTVFHKIGLHDVISVTPYTDFEVQVYGYDVDGTNILYKVVEVVKRKFHIPIRYKVVIKKNIPVGAGLGGASSNAGYFLRYLNEKKGLNLDEKELIHLGAEIGSDVPFFLIKENSAIAVGRGEILEPLNSKLNYPLVLGISKVKVLSKWAYETFDLEGKYSKFSKAYESALRIADALRNNDLAGLEYIENDFQPLVFSHYPEIRKNYNLLKDLGAKIVSLSGSGSTVFGIFERLVPLENHENHLVSTGFLDIG